MEQVHASDSAEAEGGAGDHFQHFGLVTALVVGEGLAHDVGHGFAADGCLAARDGGGEAPVAELEHEANQHAESNIDTNPKDGRHVVVPGFREDLGGLEREVAEGQDRDGVFKGDGEPVYGEL